jgi:hypothetical protein
MAILKIRVGTIDIHSRENGDISVSNVLNGRPWDEGRLPATYTPDLVYGEWMTITVPDTDERG